MTSAEPPTSSRSPWFVPIVVAVIAGVATVLAAVVPLLLNSSRDSKPEVIPTLAGKPSRSPSAVSSRSEASATETATRSGSGSLYLISYDLDASSNRTGGDQIPDLVGSDVAIAATGGALVALPERGNVPNASFCRSLIDQHGTQSIAGGDIQTGSMLCVRTSAGRIGLVTFDVVRKHGPEEKMNMILFSYVLWEA